MLIPKRGFLLKGILSYRRWNEANTIRRHAGNLPLFANAVKFSDKTALDDGVGSYTFGNIFKNAAELSNVISSRLNGKTNERVLFLCSNDVNYIVTLWAIWMSGQTGKYLYSLCRYNLLVYTYKLSTILSFQLSL